MIPVVRRICLALCLALPCVAALSAVLVWAPAIVSLTVSILGVSLLMAAETFHSKSAAALGGVLAMGGVFAWALAVT
jgi:hypothetical protein